MHAECVFVRFVRSRRIGTIVQIVQTRVRALTIAASWCSVGGWVGLLCGDQGSTHTALPVSPGAGCMHNACLYDLYDRGELARSYKSYKRVSVP